MDCTEEAAAELLLLVQTASNRFLENRVPTIFLRLGDWELLAGGMLDDVFGKGVSLVFSGLQLL